MLLNFVFSMTGFTCAALAVAAWLAWTRRSRRVALIVVAILFSYAITGIYVLPYEASRLLAKGYAPLAPPATGARQGRTLIILLGAGEWTVRNWANEGFTVFNAAGASRLLEARRVFGFYDDPLIISSGGPVSPADRRTTSAATMESALVQLGVPAQRILLETGSFSTRDEAVAIAPMVRELNPARIILVTSLFHMRRAVGAFRAVGIDTVPAVARDPYMRFRWQTWGVPSNDGFKLSGAVVHELGGIAYYAARGWYK